MNRVTNNNAVSELEQMYLAQGYESHFNKLDAEVVNEDNKCENCGGSTRYIGLKKYLMTTTSYIAICHCDTCGNEYEF